MKYTNKIIPILKKGVVKMDNILNNKNIAIERIFANNVDHPKLFGISIYFYGCDVNTEYGEFCKDCHNPELWFEDKCENKIDIETTLSILTNKIDFLFNNMTTNKLSINFVGGEPLTKINRIHTLNISKYLKEKYNDQITTLVYSWRQPNHILDQDILDYIKYIDEFVLGKFEIDKKIENRFPASTNQQYINKLELQNQIKQLNNLGGILCN
jgi:anaerobic ribonucleoside-triphosphate reductase activating protein